MDLVLSGAAIYTEEGVVPAGVLSVADGKITQIAATTSHPDALHFPANYHVVPGFIDMHVHGVGGHDVMDADANALRMICKTLAAEGTTAFLATTMTADRADIERALVTVREVAATPHEGAAILGVHLEGPFLAPAKMGAQRSDKRLAADVALMQHWQTLSKQFIKLVTLAPEETGCMALIEYLVKENIIASLGHTNATYAEASAAIAAGCSHATHLFNAMRGLHQREPGAVTAALLSPAVMVELILDGLHLHPAVVDLTFRVKGKDQIVLVTDAMRAKCMADGCYDLGGQSVQVTQGQAQLQDGTLAGSTLKMASALRNMMTFTGCSLRDVIKMTAENPARALGVFANKGSIGVGKDADLVVLDEALQVVMTVCAGQVAYRKA